MVNKQSIALIIPIALLGILAFFAFSKANSLEQELGVAIQDNTKLKSELSSKDKELNATKVELVHKVNELNSTKEELSNAENELNSTKERLMSTERKLSSTISELNITKDELSNARKELSDVKKQYNMLNDRVKQLEEQLQGYTYREDKGDMVTSYTKGYEHYKTLIEPIIGSVNNRFKFPYNIPVEVNSCGNNRSYVAYTLINVERVLKVVLCTEISDIIGNIDNIDVKRAYTKYVIYHELGHVMLKITDTITGSREESLADDFAFYMLVRENEDVDVLLALYKELARLEKEGTIDAINPSDPHLNYQQVYYDLSCLAHGADIGSTYIDIGKRDSDECKVKWYEVSNGWSKVLTLWTKSI